MGNLSEGVEGFDEDGLKVPWTSVVSCCEMHLVLPIQRAGEAIVIAIEKKYSNVGWLFCSPAPPKIYEKACCGFFFNFGS